MLKKLAYFAPVVASASLFAEDSTTTALPDIGFNVGDYISLAITSIGSPLKLIVGAAFVVALVWLAVRWFRKGVK